MTLNKLKRLLANPNLLYIKIVRKIGFKVHYMKSWAVVHLNLKSGSIPQEAMLGKCSQLAAKPGNPRVFDDPNFPGSDYVGNDLQHVLSHKFKIFSKDYFCVNKKAPKNLEAIAKIVSEMPLEVVRSYSPIDWHCDFISGYCWDDNLLHLDVPLSPQPGVDIKVPREMSRFQHVGQMFFNEGDRASNEFFLQIVDWITANPIRKGVNWACTMDVAIRAVNWIWGLRAFEKELRKYPKLDSVISKSLIEHGFHIYNNLEYYEESTGNHYLSNLVGLIYVSARIPDYKDSDRWLLFGMQELISEMHRQVYEDGFSYEASTNYHRLVVELFLSASVMVERIPAQRRHRLQSLNVKKKRGSPRLKSWEDSGINLESRGAILPLFFYEKLHRMVACTSALTKPNGLVPQIGDNDSARLHKLVPDDHVDIRDHSHILALGGELFHDELFMQRGRKSSFEADLIAGDLCIENYDLARKKQGKEGFFKDAGVAILSNETSWLCVSCGANGQNQKGGHGHNDKNSFELNVGGLDYIVDGGCPYYTSNPTMRNSYRSTFAHNTLAVEGREQDEWQKGIAGLFTLDQSCNPSLIIDETGRIKGNHDGFGQEHTRTFSLSTNKLEINDSCAFNNTKYLLFNLDPMVSVENVCTTGGEVSLILRQKNGGKVNVLISDVDGPKLLDGFFSIGFGVPISNVMFRVTMRSNVAKTVFSW